METESLPTLKKVRYGGPITDLTKEVSLPLHLGDRASAAHIVATKTGQKFLKEKPDKKEIEGTLEAFLQYLLDNERYQDAANLLWTPALFSAEPRSVAMLFDAMFENVTTMVPGAASMGKSYALGVWHYLDWRRDPLYTSVQVIGPSENHLQKNLFTHLVKLHRQSSIKFAGAEVMQLGITTDPHERSSGIFGVVIPLGKKSSGRLQGMKAVPRPVPHPVLGNMSRMRVMLEEAENIPVGIWEDVTNILSNVSGTERFKICAPFNPKDPNGPCAQRCEPVDGWLSLDIETSETWVSKRGWTVVRVDAYKSENVLLGYEKYPGLQTKEGLEKLIANAGGVGTPGYYTMARGWFPPSGVDLAVIPQHLMHEIVGEYTFTDTPEICAGVDVALEGEDTAVMCLGRCGHASGWRKPGLNGAKGDFVQFKDPRGNMIRKYVVQIDSMFNLPKGDTLRLVAAISDTCSGARVNGKYLGVDRTGNGAGVHDILVSKTQTAYCAGVNPSSSPTERRIMQEDQKLPCDEYAWLISELWFAVRKYAEYGYIKIHPNVPQDPLFHELTGRRFLLTGAKTKVESKKEYKSRGNRSPDRADATTILLHAVRLNLGAPPSATNEGARETFGGVSKQRISSIYRMEKPL